LALALDIWPWPKNEATAKVSWDYKIRRRAKMSDTARITGLPQMQCSTVN